LTARSARGEDESSEPVAEVLLALSASGASAPDQIARSTGLATASVAAAIEELRDSGRISTAAAPPERARLTEAGRAAAGEVLERERAAFGADVAARYARFRALDRALKEAITRWQVRTVGGVEVANDHRDRAHDAAVLAELVDVGARAVAWLEPLARRRSRYRGYRGRIEAALARVRAGEVGWIAGVGVDSLHSIWWQLHGDLLAILGRARGASDA
jgi:DNA-binding MarR family transcriptional regulator